jgi:hypothetical protein
MPLPVQGFVQNENKMKGLSFIGRIPVKTISCGNSVVEDDTNGRNLWE